MVGWGDSWLKCVKPLFRSLFRAAQRCVSVHSVVDNSWGLAPCGWGHSLRNVGTVPLQMGTVPAQHGVNPLAIVYGRSILILLQCANSSHFSRFGLFERSHVL